MTFLPKLSPAQRQRILLLCGGTRTPMTEIARKFGVTEGAIRKIGGAARRRYLASLRAEVQALRDAHAPTAEIAAYATVSARTAQRWTRKGKGRGTREVGAERTTARVKGTY